MISMNDINGGIGWRKCGYFTLLTAVVEEKRDSINVIYPCTYF